MADIPFPLQFTRQYSGSLDVDSVFQTETDLNNYLTSPRRYAGQVATCLEREGEVFILNNTKDAWLTVSGSGGGGIILSQQGTINCNTVDNVYTVNHDSVIISETSPVISLVVPDVTSDLFVQGINNRTEISFDVILSSTPPVTGYQINWQMNSNYTTSGGVDLSAYTLLTTTAAISANLQNQIDNISVTAPNISGAANYQLSFTNSDLVSNILTVNHNLDQKHVSVTVFNNSDTQIIPDEVTLIDSNSLQVDLTSFGTITGTWTALVINGSYGSTTQNISGYTLLTTTAAISADLQNQIDAISSPTSADFDGVFVKVSGDTMTGDLVVDSANIELTSGDLKIEQTIISSSNVINVDSNTVLDTFPISLGNAAYWDILIKDGTNFRASRVFAIWNDDGTDIKFNEISTESIGDTGSLDMDASILSGNVRLKVISVNSNWTIKYIRTLL